MAGDVIRRACADLEFGAAVVLDTETTGLDGVGIELAVIDAATGHVLLRPSPRSASTTAGCAR
ncbi:hypothetical protein [Nonomuraea sp. NPDC003804]|uniref:hypothetical protein n=1 Tax=Nonomuraea sp. NPDC003804 TaxID=3154547 RepID=UPI0033B9EDAB